LRRNLHAGLGRREGMGLKIFSADDLHDLHLATLEVLEKTGVSVEAEEALEILAGGGARVDPKTKVVKIPSYLVEDAVRSAPRKLVLAGRNPKNDIVLESNRVGFTTFGKGIMVLDPFTGEYRKSTKEDVGRTALLTDALSEIDVYERAVGARDVPGEVATLHEAEAYLANTSKHCFQGPDNGKQARKLFEMAGAVVGGKDKLRDRPIISCIACPTSPLKLTRECCEVIIECARAGVAVNILSMAMSGASAPITLAGTLITHNAEVLAGITLSQLTCRGAPVIYGSSTTIMDLKLSTAPVGAPELGMISAGVARLAQFYLLPSFVAGGWADSKVPDAQAAHEKTITGLLPALAGANLIYGLGVLELGITFSYEQLVMDNEIAKMIKRAVQGIPVSDETLAVDVINQVGAGGDFLLQEHTFRYMKTLHSQPKLLDRRRREFWQEGGAKDMTERAKEEARYILENHQPDPLPSGVAQELRSIVLEAEKEMATRKG